MCFAPDKKITPALSESEVHLYFYVPKIGEREKERERTRER
jgi:hypothetical protein